MERRDAQRPPLRSNPSPPQHAGHAGGGWGALGGNTWGDRISPELQVSRAKSVAYSLTERCLLSNEALLTL